MKIEFPLLVVLCAIAEGQSYAYGGKSDYVPVIVDGVPVDTPEVQAAKAAHFEAYERARALAARNPSEGYVSQKYRQRLQVQPYQQQAYQQQNYQGGVVYAQPRPEQYSLAAYSSALPVDTPEVQKARAAQLVALSQAQGHHYRFRRGVSGVPEETPEVQAARYQHLVAHATVHDGDIDDYYVAPNTDTEPYHIPVITRKGIPVNTGSVKAARQQHLRAYNLEKAGVRYAGGYSEGIPVISPNGVPFDTPEVYVAKAQHLAAHAKQSYGGGYRY